ncbi:MAG: type II toxin-antitoxin system prevent-host-death family antitoxin [Candidatus Acididesulfobacter guangdongensis]|uniref:Antitoxin n=1 Tax=Acididesulfobacter guangdongensis TaxID=2597225 RepID=A0A519BI01_ACIG2|nr:MAG: type II toxin-antitoxin system prevent-host-death family antitoxin [Candidatus Acididesulfobacter guangdongensis]
MIISANDIKTKGLSNIEKIIEDGDEVFISKRGKTKFVLLSLKEYERLKEADIFKAIIDAETDYKNGKFITESSEEHFKRLGI